MATRILAQRNGPIARVILEGDNPLNLLDSDALAELGALLDDLARDPGLAALRIQGGGSRAFSAGANLDRLAELDADAALAISELGQSVTLKIARLPCPVIATIQGVCFGGGLELAIACDLRLAGEDARFCYPAAKLGILPGWGGTQRCPALVGPSRAKELMFLGRVLDARTALHWGLVNYVVPSPDLEARADEILGALARSDAHALAWTKSCLDRSSEADFARERQAFAACFARPEVRERLARWRVLN